MKKTLTMILSLALVAALSIAGTLAYLTDKDNKVTNTFTVGAGVAINLDEAQVNPDGTPVEPAQRVTANTYKLVPGATYTKDPTVTVTGDDCYVFVKITNGLGDNEMEASGTYTTIAAQMAANGWVTPDGAADGVYMYDADGDGQPDVVSEGDSLEVFGEFGVKTDLDGEAYQALKDKTIVVNAYAIQSAEMDLDTALTELSLK